MIYFDTAYLARCYMHDRGFEAVRALAEQNPVASSELARLELAAAFHRKVREGMTPKARKSILAQFEQDDRDGIWHWLPLDHALLESARDLFVSLPKSVSLRSADAIHLVTAKQAGFDRVYSNDKHLLKAAPHVGLEGFDVIES